VEAQHYVLLPCEITQLVVAVPEVDGVIVVVGILVVVVVV